MMKRTITPQTIIQIMNFDNENIEENKNEDVIYSLKLIIKSNKILTLRYSIFEEFSAKTGNFTACNSPLSVNILL